MTSLANIIDREDARHHFFLSQKLGLLITTAAYTLVLWIPYLASFASNDVLRHFSSLLMLLCGLIAATLLYFRLGWRCKRLIATKRSAVGIFAIFGLALLLFGLHEAINTPAFGWDVISFYAKEAVRFNRDIASAPSISAFQVKYIHPPTMPIILALTSFFFDHSGLLIFLFLLPCLATTLYDIAFEAGAALTGFMAVIFTFSLPLVEAHMLSFGYSELWVSGLLINALIAGGIGSKSGDWVLYLSGWVSCINILLLRDNWAIWVLPLSLFLVSAIILRARSLTPFFMVWLAVLCSLFLFSQNTFLIEFTDIERLGIVHHENGATVWIGQRPIALTPQPLDAAVQAIARGIFFNSSFSVSFILWVLNGAAYFVQRSGSLNATDLIVIFPSLLLVVVVSGCFFSEFFLQFYAVSDTGFSRFLLPWVVSATTAALVAFVTVWTRS